MIHSNCRERRGGWIYALICEWRKRSERNLFVFGLPVGPVWDLGWDHGKGLCWYLSVFGSTAAG